MAQRISRAKQRIRASGAEFRLPPRRASAPTRLAAVLQVLYLIFNEGYTASSGPALHRVELTAEAIRLTRQLHEQLPDDGEVAGLLALMLLTDARRPARTRPGRRAGAARRAGPVAAGTRAAIAEGIALITATLATAPIGPYQLQAAIAAVHDEATARRGHRLAADPRRCTSCCERIAPGPMVTLNRIVALAMVDGPPVALAELRPRQTDDPALAGHHRVDAVRAHLLEMAGDLAAARQQYRLAARRTLSVPEQRYLESRAAHLR